MTAVTSSRLLKFKGLSDHNQSYFIYTVNNSCSKFWLEYLQLLPMNGPFLIPAVLKTRHKPRAINGGPGHGLIRRWLGLQPGLRWSKICHRLQMACASVGYGCAFLFKPPTHGDSCWHLPCCSDATQSELALHVRKDPSREFPKVCYKWIYFHCRKQSCKMNHPAKWDSLPGSVRAGEILRHLSRCDAAVSLLLPPWMADAKVAAFRSPEI